MKRIVLLTWTVLLILVAIGFCFYLAQPVVMTSESWTSYVLSPETKLVVPNSGAVVEFGNCNSEFMLQTPKQFVQSDETKLPFGAPADCRTIYHLGPLTLGEGEYTTAVGRAYFVVRTGQALWIRTDLKSPLFAGLLIVLICWAMGMAAFSAAFYKPKARSS